MSDTYRKEVSPFRDENFDCLIETEYTVGRPPIPRHAFYSVLTIFPPDNTLTF
jgi:hypothetical protein